VITNDDQVRETDQPHLKTLVDFQETHLRYDHILFDVFYSLARIGTPDTWLKNPDRLTNYPSANVIAPLKNGYSMLIS
jgi:hypothetical protein